MSMSTNALRGRPGGAAILLTARADFLQRVRSFRFLVVLMATVGIGMLMLPPLDAGYTVVELGGARGIYGSAWVGLVFGVVGAVILPLLGFFVVKDAVQRDCSSRVGLLLAASPLGRLAYLAAKLLSNLAILLAIMAVSSVIAVLMQLWRAEDSAVHPVDLLLMVWLIPLPVLLMTAAVALLFECVPGLRGSFGNVVFFFMWIGAFVPGLKLLETDDSRIITRRVDFYGISAPLANFEDQLRQTWPEHQGGLSIGAQVGGTPPRTLPWAGISDDWNWIVGRLLWLLASLPPLLLALAFFDRFDPARGPGAKRVARPEAAASNAGPDAAVAGETPRWHVLSPLPIRSRRWRPLTQLRAELNLLLRRRSIWWYGGLLAFWSTGLLLPVAHAVQWVVPLAWVWGLTAFSEHGARAQIHGTHSLLASAPAPLLRQLPVQWLAATLLAVLLAAGVVLKLLLLGQLGVLVQLLVGAGFVASLSLALGALSGGSRLFELGFLMLTYLAMQGAAGARIGGSLELSFGASPAPVNLLLGSGLFGLAWLLRWLGLRK